MLWGMNGSPDDETEISDYRFRFALETIEKRLADICSASFTGLTCLGLVSVFSNPQDLIKY